MIFKIKHSDILKNLLEKMNKIIELVAIKFSEEGILIMGMNYDNILASQLFVSKENLAVYTYEPNKKYRR